MAKNRDDFTSKTVDVLGKRVGFLCSNPDCRKHTIGPNSDKEKATIVGVAAHISAASPGGPRYDTNMSEKDRKSIENGIWLCVNCSTLIDKDPNAFPDTLLHSWKDVAENEISDKIKGKVLATPKEKKLAHIDVDLIYTGSSRANRGYSEKNRDIYGDNPIFVGSPMIIHWGLRWYLSLVLYNNSEYPAYNIKIIPHGENISFVPLPKINNVPALASIDVEASYSESFEGTNVEADELIKHKIPKAIVGSTFEISFTDETRVSHTSTFVITDDGIETV